MNPAIKKAIGIAGSQKALAIKVGVSQKTVHAWLHGADFAAKYIVPIVKATGGKVSTSELLDSIANSQVPHSTTKP
ncbi:YdaS family helix-turn-helix protein [Enterobacter sp.]|uniref:YdaS family helix-turn-helix protein n=1 Tax=Enterobacter sp. TaxID=42895 RepID=UPI0029026BD6|nr:YdaS family helix-turn-helix protein [Enterobacter sp.]MDU1921227.1 YdaS family helix-turn-helix protein [Enterobacter sp.]